MSSTETESPTMLTRAVQAALANNVGPKLLRDLLDEIQRLRQHWSNTSETEQRQVIDRLRLSVEQALSRAAVVMGANGCTHFTAKLVSLAVKDGIKATLELGDSTHDIAELIGKIGRGVVLVLADPSEYLEGMETVKPQPDQPSLLPDDEPAAASAGETAASETQETAEAEL